MVGFIPIVMSMMMSVDVPAKNGPHIGGMGVVVEAGTMSMPMPVTVYSRCGVVGGAVTRDECKGDEHESDCHDMIPGDDFAQSKPCEKKSPIGGTGKN